MIATTPAFVAHPLLRSGHAMTIAGALLPRRLRALRRTESRTFRTEPDTEVVALCDWQDDRAAAATLVLLHGLGGSASAGYMAGTADKAFARGLNVVRLNFRNCGGTEPRTPTLYHSGLTIDALAVMRELAADRAARFVIAGFSLGGNVAIKLAGELGAAPPVWFSGAAAVSAPIDLAACADAIDRGRMNGLYQRRYLGDLRAMLARKAALFPDRYDAARLAGVRSIREFDERFTAPSFRFAGAADYYARASALPIVPAIRTPTLLIAARDDSIVPADAFESPEVRGNANVTTLVTDHGGHVAFVAARVAPGDLDRRWAENRVVEFALRVTAATGAAR